MFKEVASLVFDIGIFLVDLSNSDALVFVNQFEGYIAAESDETKKCRL